MCQSFKKRAFKFSISLRTPRFPLNILSILQTRHDLEPKSCYVSVLLLSGLETVAVWLCRHCVILRTVQFVNCRASLAVECVNCSIFMFLRFDCRGFCSCFYVLSYNNYNKTLSPFWSFAVLTCRPFDHRPSTLLSLLV